MGSTQSNIVKLINIVISIIFEFYIIIIFKCYTILLTEEIFLIMHRKKGRKFNEKAHFLNEIFIAKIGSKKSFIHIRNYRFLKYNFVTLSNVH